MHIRAPVRPPDLGRTADRGVAHDLEFWVGQPVLSGGATVIECRVWTPIGSSFRSSQICTKLNDNERRTHIAIDRESRWKHFKVLGEANCALGTCTSKPSCLCLKKPRKISTSFANESFRLFSKLWVSTIEQLVGE